ncbi:conserved exported hypothetical protein [metagenome]|uniref:Uncharacterized protein n=1 Tax=metagenome TaxID=256318 RepID=A0A2P2BYL6_9ZZZZ
MRAALAGAALLVLALAGCTGDPDASPTPRPSTGASSPTPDETPTTTRLTWQPVDAATTDTVTQGDGFAVVVDQSKRAVTLDEAGESTTFRAPARFQFNDVLTDGSWLVLVAQDEQEVQPSRATVVELATGKRSVIDGESDLPTVNGGSWAIADGTVLHPTFRGTAYCLAKVDLASLTSELGYCAPRRGGFSHLVVSPQATSLLTFSGRPQCRTVASLDGAEVVPFAEVTECKGWDGAVTADGTIWSEVRNENRVEQAEFFASDEGTTTQLGVGTTGSLTWCGDSAYFVRDSQGAGSRAQLLRWTPSGRLDVAYESPGRGEAFLATPRCAGDVLSVSAFGEGGDEQVWAKVPG